MLLLAHQDEKKPLVNRKGAEARVGGRALLASWTANVRQKAGHVARPWGP